MWISNVRIIQILVFSHQEFPCCMGKWGWRLDQLPVTNLASEEVVGVGGAGFADLCAVGTLHLVVVGSSLAGDRGRGLCRTEGSHRARYRTLAEKGGYLLVKSQYLTILVKSRKRYCNTADCHAIARLLIHQQNPFVPAIWASVSTDPLFRPVSTLHTVISCRTTDTLLGKQ